MLHPTCLYGLETVALTEQLGSTNNKNKEGGQKKDERPEERDWGAMQPNLNADTCGTPLNIYFQFETSPPTTTLSLLI